jgi:hypothetical protein
MRPPGNVMDLVGLLRWHACMLRELYSGELLYKSYRLGALWERKRDTI